MTWGSNPGPWVGIPSALTTKPLSHTLSHTVCVSTVQSLACFMLRNCIAIYGNQSQSYGASPAMWDSTVLFATRCRWTCPAKQASTRFTYRRGMDGWVDVSGCFYTEMVYLSANSYSNRKCIWNSSVFWHKVSSLRHMIFSDVFDTLSFALNCFSWKTLCWWIMTILLSTRRKSFCTWTSMR